VKFRLGKPEGFDACSAQSRHLDALRVFLFGGLGNQLFQLAAGLQVSNGRPIILDSRFTLPRSSQGTTPDIGDLQLPENVFIDFQSVGGVRAKLGRLATQYLLASTINSKLCYREFIASPVGAAFGYAVGLRGMHMSQGVGNDPNLQHIPTHVGLVGYFQSAAYAETLKTALCPSGLVLPEEPDWLQALRREALGSSVTVVHVRLADYASSSLHRIADYSFYDLAMKIIEERSPIDQIWLFSDEPARALEHLSPLWGRRNVRSVPDPGVLASPAQVLTAMTLGTNFIIPASTFGYWGATLGETTKTVVCPDQWFHGAPDPEGLVPNHWVRIGDGARA